MKPASTGPPARFFWFLGLLTVAAGATYAAAVLAGATLADVRALDGIAAEHEHWHIQPVTAHGLNLLTWFLGLSAALFTGLSIILARHRAGRRELRALATELRQATAAISKTWRALPPEQQRAALTGLLALTALRTYFSVSKPLHPEEIASYEYFVSRGLLAVSAYYPIPNNHILSNALDWAFYQLNPGFWWSMRLPVLLASTAGTAALFALLLRQSNFRVAALATGLFCWLQLSLYNASAGRGYWLLIPLAGVVFFCALKLARTDYETGGQRAAWAGLVLAGVAGGYTVPSFAYALGSALSWLGWHLLRQRRWAEMGRLGGVAVSTLAASAALYAPVLLVSGAGQLFGNGFVAAQPASVFWAGLPSYVWFTEGMLAGQRTVGGLLVLGAVGAFAYWRLRAHSRPEPLGGLLTHKFQLGTAALWFLGFPYALIIAQRVFPPERVLLYKSFFLFVLVGLLADAWLRRPLPLAWRRWSVGAIAAGCLVFAAYQTAYVEFLNRRNNASVAAYRAGFGWLSQQPAGPVLVPEPLHEIYFRFYAHSSQRRPAWQFDMHRRPNCRYAYVVAFPNRRGAFQPRFSLPPAYHNAELEIYALPAAPLLLPARQ